MVGYMNRIINMKINRWDNRIIIDPSGYFINILRSLCHPSKPECFKNVVSCLLGFYKNSIWHRHLITSLLQPEVTWRAKLSYKDRNIWLWYYITKFDHSGGNVNQEINNNNFLNTYYEPGFSYMLSF